MFSSQTYFIFLSKKKQYFIGLWNEVKENIGKSNFALLNQKNTFILIFKFWSNMRIEEQLLVMFYNFDVSSTLRNFQTESTVDPQNWNENLKTNIVSWGAAIVFLDSAGGNRKQRLFGRMIETWRNFRRRWKSISERKTDFLSNSCLKSLWYGIFQ